MSRTEQIKRSASKANHNVRTMEIYYNFCKTFKNEFPEPMKTHFEEQERSTLKYLCNIRDQYKYRQEAL